MIKKNRIKKIGVKGGYTKAATEPKNFARVTVKRWLMNNASRFLNPPRITDVSKNGFSLKFRGITPQIVLRIYQGWALEVRVIDDKDNWWDIITDFDLGAEQDDAGRYYCCLCVEERREFFPSKRELWEKHSLEPALAWANENLRPDRWLCLFGKPNESGWAELVDADKLPECRQAKKFYAAYPVGVNKDHLPM